MIKKGLLVKNIAAILVCALFVGAVPLLANAEVLLPVVGVQCSTTLGGNMGPAQLINGNKNDMFSSQSDANCWIYFEFDEISDVEYVTLYARTDKYMFPDAVKFFYSIDGIDWTPVAGGDFSFENGTAGDRYTLNVINTCEFAAPVTARFIKVQTIASKFDGVSYLTQLAEIEAYGGEATGTGEETLQSYKIKRIGDAESRFFQFEDVGMSPDYPSDAFFIPYYMNPIFGDGQTRAPAAIFYDNSYLVAYEVGEVGSTEIYAKTSMTDQIDSFYNAEFKLASKGLYDCLRNPSFVTAGSKTYLAVEAVKNQISKIAIVEYTGQSSIVISEDDIVDLTTGIAGFNGEMECPSLTYDNITGRLRLYFINRAVETPVMYFAESSDNTIGNLVYKQAIEKLRYGKVFFSKGGYFAVVSTFFDDTSSVSEWISSEDGIAFTREGAIVKGNSVLNGKEFSTGAGCPAIDPDGSIAAMFVETYLDDSGNTAIMMALPQMRVLLSREYYTLTRTMAMSSTVQIIMTDRDYSSTDLVRIYRTPSETTVYELRQNLTTGASYQVMPITSTAAVRDTAEKIGNPSLNGLRWVMPLSVDADAYFPIFSADNLIAYDENLQWQTTARYTFDPQPETLVVQLPATMDIGAFSFAGFSGDGSPSAFRVFISNDNVTYDLVRNQTRFDYPILSTKEDRIFRFDAPVSGRFLKIVFDRYTPNLSFMCQVVLSKIKIYAEDPAAMYIYDPATLIRGFAETMMYGDKTLGAVAITDIAVSSELNPDNWSKAHLIDHDNGTLWSTASDQTGQSKEFVIADLGQATDVARVELIPRGDVVCFPKNFTISSSMDGTTWTLIPGQSYTNYPVPDPLLHQYFTFSTPVNARYIKLNIEKQRSDGSNFMSHLAGIEIHKVID